MIDTSVCIDTGNSGTKIVYLNPDTNKLDSLFMSSALDEVEPEQLENQLKNFIGFPKSDQQSWVKVDNRFVAVGELAEKFSPRDRRKISKYENALYKILSAIGVIVETHFIPIRRRVKIQLGLLLPWNEYKDRERLLGELKRISPEYEFRGRKIRVIIEKFVCYPEGGGIAMARAKSQGLDWFKQERFGVLMLGDRNWTGLYFESGEMKKGASPLEGFSFLLDQIIDSAPCLLNRERLGNAIFKGIAESSTKKSSRLTWSELKAIQSLATARNANLRRSEINDIDRAITQAERSWSIKLERFMAEIFPQKLTEINVCGGALPFFKLLIENYFNCVVSDSADNCSPTDIAKPYTQVIANGGTTKTVAEVLRFKSITAIESAFSTRFADVFSLIDFMSVEEKKLAKQIK